MISRSPLRLALRNVGLRFASLALALFPLVACGGDEDPCDSMVETICAAACTCGGAAGCAIGDASGAITFDNKAGCQALYGLACSQPAPSGFSYSACEKALATPMCVASTDGQALMLPAVCDQ